MIPRAGNRLTVEDVERYMKSKNLTLPKVAPEDACDELPAVSGKVEFEARWQQLEELELGELTASDSEG